MRNGPYRWKTSTIGKAIARHGVVVELVLAALAQEGPHEGVVLIENWSGSGDMDVRGWPHRPFKGEHP